MVKHSRLKCVTARELARRYVEFHDGQDWKSIKLWGLAHWGEVSKLIKTGDIVTNMKKEDKTIWFTPSPHFYAELVAPAIAEYRADSRKEKCLCWFMGDYPNGL
jgi:hypothetical protein